MEDLESKADELQLEIDGIDDAIENKESAKDKLEKEIDKLYETRAGLVDDLNEVEDIITNLKEKN